MRAALTVIVLAILLSPPFARGADTNLFSNKELGLTLVKPPDWIFLTPEQHAENLKRAKLKDQALMKWLREHSKMPLVGMFKHPEPFNDLNPSLRLSVAPQGTTPTNNLTVVLEVLVAVRKDNFSNFKVKTEPREITFNGHRAAHTRFTYDVEVPDGRKLPASGEIWLLAHKDQFVIIVLELHQDEKTGKRAEFESILNSLKLE